MEIVKKSSIVLSIADFDRLNEYVNYLDDDVQALFTAVQGKLRFGSGSDAAIGENISGQWQVVADTGAADTEFTVAHDLGAVPIGYLITKIDKAGVVYDSGTAWTTTNAYFKCSVANCAVSMFLIK